MSSPRIRVLAIVPLAVAISCTNDSNSRALGGNWYVQANAHIIEAGRVPRSLVRGTGRGRVTVADMLEQEQFYPPDCVAFQTARHGDVSIVCGNHAPIAVGSSLSGEWKLTPDGLRRVSEPIVSGSGLVREIDEIPIDTLRALAMRQPAFSRQRGAAPAFDPSQPPAEPIHSAQQVTPSSDPEALVRAVSNNQLAQVQALLANGADPSAHNDRNISALMIASGRGDTLMVDTLLAAGASVHAVDNNGRTAMMYGTLIARDAIRARLEKAGARR